MATVSVWLRSTKLTSGPPMNLAVFAHALLLCFSFARRLGFALGYGAPSCTIAGTGEDERPACVVWRGPHALQNDW
jgi:hypothetical protein